MSPVSTQAQFYIAENSDAVDVYAFSKRDGLARILADTGFRADQTAVIGDSENDLSFLSAKGIALRGAPGNAQQVVRSYVGPEHVTASVGLDGFLEFYAICKERGIQLIVSDRDGVIKWKDESALPQLKAVWRGMGSDGPAIVVLTGSSIEQNLRFIDDYGLSAARDNSCVQRHPYLIYAENGAVALNILTRQAIATPTQHGALIAELKSAVLKSLESGPLARWGITLTHDPLDQRWKCYVPDKSTMLTINLPRLDRNGEFFRDSADAEQLRREIGAHIRQVAQAIKLPLHQESKEYAC